MSGPVYKHVVEIWRLDEVNGGWELVETSKPLWLSEKQAADLELLDKYLITGFMLEVLRLPPEDAA